MSLLLSSLAVLLAGAVASIVLSWAPRVALLAAMGAVLVSAALSVVAAMGALLGSAAGPETFSWPLPLGSATLALDGLSAWFLLTIGIVSAAVAIYTPRYMSGEAHGGSLPFFGLCMCVLEAALMIVACAADTVLFLVAWEAMTLAAFFLVSFHHDRPEVRQGAWMYLVATHLGTALFLVPMFALLAAMAGGSTDGRRYAEVLASAEPRTLMTIFLMGLIGFGTKAGFMPMHVWLPNAHPVAPTPVSALLSGVVIKTGIYGLLRLLSWLPPLPASAGIVLLTLGMISGVLGVLYALAQHDLKRLLAYHSVENIGIIGLGIGIGMLGQRAGLTAVAALGYGGALLHVLNHAIFKALLFLSAGAVMHATGTGEIDRLGGLAKRTPANAALFLMGAVAICGLPPLNGFVSEWLIYGSLFRGGWTLTGLGAPAAVAALTSLALMGGLALACFAKVFGVVFLGERRDDTLPAHTTPHSLLAGMGILGLLCLLIGILPAPVLRLVASGLSSIGPGANAEAVATMSLSLVPSYALTAMAVLVAVLIALLLLARRWGPRKLGAADDEPLTSTDRPTWGCGYPRPTARMQYSASSFAWSLVSGFGALLWPRRHLHAPAGPFPTRSSLETHTADIAETDFFAPLFRGVARASRMFKTVSWTGELPRDPSPLVEETAGPVRLAVQRAVFAIRRGNIQISLTYVVLTLLAVFLVEATTSPRMTAAPTSQPVTPIGRISE